MNTALKSLSRISKVLVLSTSLLALGAVTREFTEVYQFLKADVTSEISRKQTPGKPKIGILPLVEHVKTARDFFQLYLINDLFDSKDDLNLYIDKGTNIMYVYQHENGTFANSFNVGTGQVKAQQKERFGQYVTPSGNYLLINKINRSALEEKFGNNAKLYGSGMLQLLGPWAPHIAIHGTNDNSRIGKYSTNGCINLANENLEWLLSNAGIGSKVYVYDSKANN